MAKFKVRFIEIISHFKSDIRSCRCNNSSIKQASCLIGGLDPPDPPPWIRQCSQYVSIHYTAQHVTRRVSHFTASAIFGYIKRLSWPTKIKKLNQYETRLASKKSLPKARTKYGKFNSSSANLWNSVPDDLKSEGRSCFRKPLLEESMPLNIDWFFGVLYLQQMKYTV